MRKAVREHSVLTPSCSTRVYLTAPSQDGVYEGHFIPAGTTVVANLWAVHRDESIYPNADQLDPKRFLNEDGTLNNLQFYSFGFGRRKCVALE